VSSVGTCPLCLPVGSIHWLIENGRQLELELEEGVVPLTRGREADDHETQVTPDGEAGGLPF